MRGCHHLKSRGLYRRQHRSKAISACEDVISFVSPGGLIIAKMSSVWLNPVVSIILVESVRVRLANGHTRLLAVRQSVHARMSSAGKQGGLFVRASAHCVRARGCSLRVRMESVHQVGRPALREAPAKSAQKTFLHYSCCKSCWVLSAKGGTICQEILSKS